MMASTKRQTRSLQPHTVFLVLAVLAAIFLFFNFTVPKLTLHSFSEKPTYFRKQKPLPQCSSNGLAKTFLIVFMGNSGSTAISTELLAHPQTYMQKLEYVKEYENVTDSLAATRAFFEEGVAKGLTPGFKIRPGHILKAPEEWKKLAIDFDTRIIWNYRKNVIKSSLTEYVKMVLQDDLGTGGLQKNISIEERCQLGQGCRHRVDVPKLHEMMKRGLRCNSQIITGVNLLDGGRGCVWEVPYEDYLHYREETIEDLQQFLGLERVATQPTRFKGTKDDLCAAIENYDELCERLYGCVIWQGMLEDGINGCYCKHYISGDGRYCDISTK